MAETGCLTVFYLRTVNTIHSVETWAETWPICSGYSAVLTACVCVCINAIMSVYRMYTYTQMLVCIDLLMHNCVYICVYLETLTMIQEFLTLNSFGCCLLSQGHCICSCQSEQQFKCTAVHVIFMWLSIYTEKTEMLTVSVLCQTISYNCIRLVESNNIQFKYKILDST